MNIFIKKYLDKISMNLNKISDDDFKEFINDLRIVKKKNSKIIFVGNGGSAAMASHVSVDFTKVCKIRSVNFNEADLITCYSNDYGYKNWVKEALKSFVSKNDLIVLFSSSGNSQNMINAAKYCNKNKFKLVTFTGFNKKNILRRMGKINFWVDSKEYNIVEMTHHIWILMAVDYLALKK